jgi:HK97 family phage prohead protease
MSKETRILSADGAPLEVRTDESGATTLVGYGAVFNSLSQDLGGFREKISPTAFNRTIQNQKDILATLNHNVDALLGRTSAGTLRIGVDDIGVRYEVDLPDTSAGRDVATLASRRDLFGSSFTFSITKGGDSWEKTDDGQRIRTLEEVRLYELGPVVSPAYLDTTVALRSLESLEDDTDEEEDPATATPSLHTLRSRLIR